MSRTSIEWTHRPGTLPEVWNPVTGCTKVSAGCKHCYAEQMHRRLQYMYPQKYSKGFTEGIQMHEDIITIPFQWKKPRTVFVNSMSDLFHGGVTDDFIELVFTIIRKTPQHTYIILTKRPERMHDFMNMHYRDNPPANAWMGASVEDQASANERVPMLLCTPAAIRFISAEPLLGRIDIESIPTSMMQGRDHSFKKINYLDWVIVGGESGHDARPMHPDWARSLMRQCEAAGVPFFFKQWGTWLPLFVCSSDWDEGTGQMPGGKHYVFHERESESGFKHMMQRGNKKVNGRLLDNREFNEYPEKQKEVAYA